jgi:hypothetical protein
VLVRARVDPSRAHGAAAYMAASTDPDARVLTTHRGVLLGGATPDGKIKVAVPTADVGGVTELAVAEAELLRLNQPHLLPKSATGACQLEDGISISYVVHSHTRTHACIL